MKSPKSCHQGLISVHVQSMRLKFFCVKLNFCKPQKIPNTFCCNVCICKVFSQVRLDKDTFFFLDFFFFSGDVLVVLSIDAMEGVLTDGGIESLEFDPDPT